MKSIALFTLGILAATVASGCAAQSESVAETSSEAVSARAPGSTRLTMTMTNERATPRGFVLLKPTDSSRDEFVRVGAALTLAIPDWDLWNNMHNDIAEPYDDVVRTQKVKMNFRVEGFKNGARVSDVTLTTKNFSGGDGRSTFNMVASTDAYTVPAADTLKISGTLVDEADGSSKAYYGIRDIAVYGADPNARTFVFDENRGVRRERIIESGDLAGTEARIVFSEYRADNVSRRYELEGAGKRTIGRGKNAGDRGVEMDILGDLVHEVSVSASFDGSTWTPEKLLAPSTTFTLGDFQKTSEAMLSIPGTASQFSTYFHVKTFVVVAYSHVQYYDVTLRYPEGTKQLVDEKWDNRGGLAGQNYEFPIRTP